MKNKRIVVADDDPIFRLIIRQILHHQGSLIYEVENGVEALSLLSSVDIDLLITDYEMPEMNGLELVDACNLLPFSPPAIFVTKFSETQLIREAWKKGVFDFFQKPLDRARFLEVVKIALAEGARFNEDKKGRWQLREFLSAS